MTSVPLEPNIDKLDEDFCFRALPNFSPGHPDVDWGVIVPAWKIGDQVVTGQLRFDVAHKRAGSRLMQVKNLAGHWSPGQLSNSGSVLDHARLVIMRVQFITLIQFDEKIPPIPATGPIGDDDEPTASYRLKSRS
jgi:hypothetical protein